jgi:hypothetical protein
MVHDLSFSEKLFVRFQSSSSLRQLDQQYMLHAVGNVEWCHDRKMGKGMTGGSF